MNKRLADQLRPLLDKNTVPPIRRDLRRTQIQQLTRDALNMDILSRHSVLEHILLQATYLSRWIWLAQAALLTVLFFHGFQGNPFRMFPCILLIAPCLTLCLLYEVSKSLAFGMWEMEAPCRYSHLQLLTMRLCFLSGTDTVVLLGALLSFRMVGGSLWQFALYVLLPFFLTSALCLHMIRIYTNRISQYMVSAIALLCSGLLIILLFQCSEYLLAHHPELYEKIILFSTRGALLLFICSAVRICRRQSWEPDAQALKSIS